MGIIKHKTDNTSIKVPSFEFEIISSIDKDKSIIDTRLLSELLAGERAKAELLENGYKKETIEFEIVFNFLEINDIIKIIASKFNIPKDLSKSNFKVIAVTHFFKEAKATSKIKALRYEEV